MENNENTVDIQDEIQEDETLEDESEGEENSTQLQEELKKKEQEIAKLQRLLNKKEPKQEATGDLDLKTELEKVKLVARGYDDEQVDFLMKFGGSKALSDSNVKRVVDAMKEEKEQLKAQATSTTQSKSDTKYSEDKLRGMSSDEILKLYREGKLK